MRKIVKISQKGLQVLIKQVIITVSFEKQLRERNACHVEGRHL